jgi:hypothetical protein
MRGTGPDASSPRSPSCRPGHIPRTAAAQQAVRPHAGKNTAGEAGFTMEEARPRHRASIAPSIANRWLLHCLPAPRPCGICSILIAGAASYHNPARSHEGACKTFAAWSPRQISCYYRSSESFARDFWLCISLACAQQLGSVEAAPLSRIVKECRIVRLVPLIEVGRCLMNRAPHHPP